MSRHAFPLLHVSATPRACSTVARPGQRARSATARRAACLLVLLGACGSDPSAGGPDAQPGLSDGSIPEDARPGAPVAHVPAEGAFPGRGRLILQDGAIIDTDSLTVNGQAYAGLPGDSIVFDAWPQAGDDAPELAVLHVGDFGIERGTVTVRGARALVILAGQEIRLAGMLDASASAQAPGPGGFSPGAGPGVGGDGRHAGNSHDGGGGGGGHGSAGGEGGTASCASVGDCPTGGAAGVVYGESGPSILRGGSGGGTGAGIFDREGCVPGFGGAGGGAVQLTAQRLRIGAAGGVHVGGGGGAGGAPDNPCGENGGGGGGGAGGAIYLQAPDIQHRGVLAANGGGGGAGASDSQQRAGLDAEANDQPAPGGERVSDFGQAGGCGDALNGTSCDHNGASGQGQAGGGGGGVGRIIALTVPGGYDGRDSVASPMVDVRVE